VPPRGPLRLPPAWRLRDVGLRYGKVAALDGIDLDIPPAAWSG
jgi:hypothetical protein